MLQEIDSAIKNIIETPTFTQLNLVGDPSVLSSTEYLNRPHADSEIFNIIISKILPAKSMQKLVSPVISKEFIDPTIASSAIIENQPQLTPHLIAIRQYLEKNKLPVTPIDHPNGITSLQELAICHIASKINAITQNNPGNSVNNTKFPENELWRTHLKNNILTNSQEALNPNQPSVIQEMIHSTYSIDYSNRNIKAIIRSLGLSIPDSSSPIRRNQITHNYEISQSSLTDSKNTLEWFKFRSQLIERLSTTKDEKFTKALEQYQKSLDITKINKIFGAESEISTLEGGGYRIVHKLEEDIPGSILLDLNLSPSRLLTIHNLSGETQELEIFEVKSMSINGVKITDRMPITYLVPPYAGDLYDADKRAFIHEDKPTIKLDQLAKVSDFISMAHEVGHCDTFSNFNLQEFIQTKERYRKGLLSKPEIILHKQQLAVIESQASIAGAKFMQQIIELTNIRNISWQSIKEQYVEMLNTYISYDRNRAENLHPSTIRMIRNNFIKSLEKVIPAQ